jgi:hypothetical protein
MSDSFSFNFYQAIHLSYTFNKTLDHHFLGKHSYTQGKQVMDNTTDTEERVCVGNLNMMCRQCTWYLL